MNRSLLRVAIPCAALVAAAIGVAATASATDASSAPAPTGDTAPGRATTVAARDGASLVTTVSPTTTTSTTTTTAPAPIPLGPGELAAPTPPAPVTLPGSVPVIDRVATDDKVIFLGIDDGLVRDPELLSLLRAERIPLTLFLVRQPAFDGASYFRQLQGLGATVQGHTRTHPRLPSLGAGDQRREICDELDDLTTLYGVRPTLFRPPYAEWNETTRAVASGCGLQAIVLWRGTTNDGRLDIVGGRFRPGDILLMHFRSDLVENLRLVLARARAEGFRIGRLEDYLGTGPPHPMFDR